MAMTMAAITWKKAWFTVLMPIILGNTGWTPVGYYGAAFLETPGNPYDGIDNDFDAKDSVPERKSPKPCSHRRRCMPASEIIAIDYKTFVRTKTDSCRMIRCSIPYRDRDFEILAGSGN